MDEITTTAHLETYLHSADIPLSSLEKLSGGMANYVWRLRNPSAATSIIKHAESQTAHSASPLAFSVSRMDFENKALTALPAVVGKGDGAAAVSMPRVYRYDEGRHVLTLEDGGSRTLKEAYVTPELDVESCGRSLGKWLATLHSRTAKTEIGNNQAAKTICRFATYSRLAPVLERWGFDAALGEKVEAEYGSLLERDDECVCHGDFWPGNVIVGDEATEGKLMVVDWEMVRRGCGATDVGQFAAEAWLLDRFRGGRGLSAAFLEGYREVAGLKEMGWARRVAVHMGAHLAFWPTFVEWGTQEETRDVVGFGVEILQRAVGGEWEWFKGGVLSELFRDQKV